MSFGSLNCTPEIEAVWLENEPGLGNNHPPDPIALSHVQNDFFVGHDIMVEREIVAVGVNVVGIVWIKLNVRAKVSSNFFAGKNHSFRFRGMRYPLRSEAFLRGSDSNRLAVMAERFGLCLPTQLMSSIRSGNIKLKSLTERAKFHWRSNL